MRRHIEFVGRTADIPPLIVDLPLFTAAETAGLHRQVLRRRRDWIPRGTTGITEFHTLGVATYLDFCCSDDPETDYLGRAPTANRVLARSFAGLYRRLRDALQRHLGEPVRYTRRFALPGFHIFLGQAIDRAAGAPVHFDQQYQYLPWEADLDPVPPLSFTLPVALPAAGGGLDLWHMTPDDVTRAVALGIEPDLDRLKERRFRIPHPYRAGSLALHSGLMLHRIGTAPVIRDDDERITLQGHAVRIRGTWVLHW